MSNPPISKSLDVIKAVSPGLKLRIALHQDPYFSLSLTHIKSMNQGDYSPQQKAGMSSSALYRHLFGPRSIEKRSSTEHPDYIPIAAQPATGGQNETDAINSPPYYENIFNELPVQYYNQSGNCTADGPFVGGSQPCGSKESQHHGEKRRHQDTDLGTELGLNAPEGEKRKRKKYVPGGRILPCVKVQEYHDLDLYCKVCDTHMQDQNAMGLHMKSRRHLKALQHHEEYGTAPPAPTTIKSRESLEKKCDTVVRLEMNELEKLFEATEKKFDRWFKDWATRSLQGAEARFQGEERLLVLQSVKREIIAVFQCHTDNCTMRRQCWARMPLATGILYP